jgi:GntR family transcriptional regulator
VDRRGLYTILAGHGLTVTGATLGPLDARDLARPEASPALLSHQISYTATGTAIIDDHALLPGDSIAITANRSPGRLDMQYTLAG